MSGINELKKKAKLSFDEMYDSPTTIAEENQEDGKQENHLSGRSEPLAFKKSPLENQINERSKSDQSKKIENGQIQISSEKIISQTNEQPTQKIPTYKMTFNLSEKAYKTFNNLYAKRMLMGRKTEKSEMICEAIQWLLEVEQIRESNMEGDHQNSNELIEKLTRSFKSI